MNLIMLKEDINFLEYPNWTISNKTKVCSIILKKDNGFYEMKSSEGLPARFDKVILYYLLHKLFQSAEPFCIEIITTRYEIAKNVLTQEKNFSKSKYDRIMLALKKWKALCIRFEGVFYENDAYTIKYFSIIDYVSLNKETNKLTIKFNEAYIKQLHQSSFYRTINFYEYKKLTRPISARLYELLVKNVLRPSLWCINIEELAEQLTLEKRNYPSHILLALNPAIKDINKCTQLLVEFDYDKVRALCIFKIN